MSQKELIISLIKDDLTITHLVLGLDALGLDANRYYLHLNETIFCLLEIAPDREDVFEHYRKECQLIEDIDIFKYPQILDSMALNLYNFLIEKLQSQPSKK